MKPSTKQQTCRHNGKGNVECLQCRKTQGSCQYAILIIEDNSYVREAFELTLQRTSLNAMVLTTAEEAMKAVQQHRFDIVICDYRLPGMDGMEFLELAAPHIRSSTKILTSAYGFEDINASSALKIVDHFVLKPFSIHQLLLELNIYTDPAAYYPSEH